MSYVVLARKWRPQSFDDLVGQEHVAQTLANAIALGRVAHAFLFTGVRGVGKTTSARILAKTLNCVHGPTAKPCLVCPPCVEIMEGRDLDVLEIDGATYTSVDDIRDLQEKLPYRPSRDRSKIFIVDEVHMLSKSAWNAFLKTLEEPPPHVKFIFATTEVEKVPVTILSRCQRYDFKLIAQTKIAARLRHVLDAEKIEADEEALLILAREAAGSMRDAMSLLDQVIAWAGPNDPSGGRLTAANVARVLGVASRSELHALAEGLVRGDAKTCLRVLGELARQGFDIVHVARDLLDHLRDLVVARAAPDERDLVDVPDAELAALRSLAGEREIDDLCRLHQGLSRTFDEIAKSIAPRGALEMTLVRLASRPPLVPVDDLVRRLGEIEQRLGGSGQGGQRGGSGGGGGAAPGGSGARGPAAGARSGDRGAHASESIGAQPIDGNVVAPVPARPDALRGDTVRPDTVRRDDPRENGNANGAAFAVPRFVLDREEAARREGAPSSAAAEGPHAEPRDFDAPPPSYRDSAPPSARPRTDAATTTPSNGSHAAVAIPSRAGPIAAPIEAEPAPLLPEEHAKLAQFALAVDALRETNVRLASLLERAHVADVSAERVVIAFDPTGFEASQLDTDARGTVERAIATSLGGAVLAIEETSPGTRGVTLARFIDEARRKKRRELDVAARNHPLVLAAIRELGAEIREIRLPDDIDFATSPNCS